MNQAELSIKVPELVFPYVKWSEQLDACRERYQNGAPFPHVILDDFLHREALEQGLAEFPDLKSGDWIHYIHFNEKKFGKNKLETLPPTLKAIIEELNSDRFVSFLSELTGIKGLLPDTLLEGGGLHQSSRGGFLNIHADFTVHPHHRHWQRRVNVLVYLNESWEDSYGGHLELWDKEMTHCIHKISPIFNRCVIFNTDADSYHGHPHPLQCPDGVTRKSIALYYFTEETAPLIRSTEYRARPDDGYKGLLIFMDKIILRLYDRIKRRLGIKDDFVSKVLEFFGRCYGRWR